MNTLTEDENKLIARLTETTPDVWRVTENGAFTCDQDVYALDLKQYIDEFDSHPSKRQGADLKKSGYLFFDSKEGAMQFNNAVSLMAEKCGGASNRMNERNQHERLWDAEKGEQVIPKLDNHVSSELLNLAPLVVGKTNMEAQALIDMKERLEKLFNNRNPHIYTTDMDGFWTEADVLLGLHSTAMIAAFPDDHNMIPEKYCKIKQLKQYSVDRSLPDPSTQADWSPVTCLHHCTWLSGINLDAKDMTISIEYSQHLFDSLNMAVFSFCTLDRHRYNSTEELLSQYWSDHEMYNEKGEHVYKMDGKDYKTNAQRQPWATPEIKEKAWYVEWLADLNRARSDAKIFMKEMQDHFADEGYEFVYEDNSDEDRCVNESIKVYIKRKAPEMPYHALALFPKMAREIESCHETLRTLLAHAQATNDEVALQHLAPFDMATMEATE